MMGLLLLLALQLLPSGATALDVDEFNRLKSRLHLKLDDDVLAVEPNATHLLFDDHYTSERDGLEFVMHQPRRTGERSVTPELPWETHIAGYNSGELG